MNHIRFSRITLAAALLVGLSSAGCKEEAPKVAPPKPGPKESFDEIVETFRHIVEDTPIGFVMRDSGGRSMMTGKNMVSAELISPTNESEKLKGLITVESQTSYSINRSKNEAEKDSSRDKESRDNDNFLADNDRSDVQIYDQDVVSQSGEQQDSVRPEPETTKDIVAQQPTTRKRQYELVYENGRWTLVTKLDPGTEQSIQNAFNQALKTQG